MKVSEILSCKDAGGRRRIFKIFSRIFAISPKQDRVGKINICETYY